MGSPSSRQADLTILDIIEETADARSIVLAVPEHLSDAFAYRPGQFLTTRIPSTRTGSVARSYSLSSAPGIDQDLKITVKRTDGGYGSNWLCDNLRVGDTLTVLPPAGLFTPADLDAGLLLFAAGSGITPMMSILRAALSSGSGQIFLFCANRDRDSVIFRDELVRLEEEHGGRLTVRYWFDAEHGVPDPAQIESVAHSVPDTETFLCGPAPFMDTVVSGLEAAGIPRERVHREVFTSLSGDPFADVDAPDIEQGPGTDSSAEGTETVVHIDGDTHSFTWAAKQTLVDALLHRGVDVPYSCRSGECGSCACTVVRGEVRMNKSDILDENDIADGYILGCQAKPVSESVEITF